MKVQEYKVLSFQELNDKLADLRKQLMELNSQKKASRVEKPHRYKEIKKDIARVLTVIKEKENEKS